MTKEKGWLLIKSFLNTKSVKLLNEELLGLFREATINFSYGYIKVQPFTKAVPFPLIYLRSINLTELVIDTYLQIEKSGLMTHPVCLSDVQVFNDSDPKELPWHTDHSLGGILAIIYINGGGDRSGSARYIEGTHLKAHDKSMHHVSPTELAKYRDNDQIKMLEGSSGDLVLYHINGFHSRAPCNTPRTSIRLTFLPKGNEQGWPCDDIYIPTSAITEKVLTYLPTILKPHDRIPKFTEVDLGAIHYMRKPLFLGVLPVLRYLKREVLKILRRKIQLIFDRKL